MKFCPPIPLKQFCHEQAEACHVSPGAIWYRVSRGQYRAKLKRVNDRVVLVLSADLAHVPRWLPQPGELRHKDFISSEASRLGVSRQTIIMRYVRGKYNDSTITRRVNARVVFVKPTDVPTHD